MKIASAASSKMAWDILETCYQGVSKVKIAKLQNLKRNFENLKMKDNESVYFHDSSDECCEPT